MAIYIDYGTWLNARLKRFWARTTRDDKLASKDKVMLRLAGIFIGYKAK